MRRPEDRLGSGPYGVLELKNHSFFRCVSKINVLAADSSLAATSPCSISAEQTASHQLVALLGS